MNKEISDKVILDFCKTFLSKENFEKLSKKINNPQNTRDDFYAELIIGGIMGYLGLNIEYELDLLGKTPDWTILDNNQNIFGIIECSQLHIDHETDKKTSINDSAKPVVMGYWMDEERNNSDRLFEKLSDKARKYKNVVKKENICYIIAIYINGKLEFFEDEIRLLLYDDSGFFNEFSEVDGVIIVSEIGNYIFKFQYWCKPMYTSTDMLPSEVLIDMHKKQKFQSEN